MPESGALMNLRKALQQIRQQMGPHLIIGRQSVAFNHDLPYLIDVVVLQAAANRAKEVDRIPSALLSQLEQAIALYQGDFLEGFFVRDAPEFELWSLGQRAHFRELVLQLMHVAAAQYARQGQYGTAIEFTRKLLNLEPWREAAHQDLIRLLAYDGERGAALAQYESCRRILQEELGVEPSGQTQALYRSVQEDTLRPPRPSPVRHLQMEPHRPAFLHEGYTDGVASKEPFVGRENQLSQLAESLATSLAGQGKVIFAGAEAGWGKTSLLAHFARRAQARYPDLVVANGICTTYTGAGDPYLPFREILRMLSADIEGKWAAGTIAREHALRLWNLLPSSIEALVGAGCHLLDTFVPSQALLERAAAHGGVAPGLARQLQDLVGRVQDAGLNQEHIFEEYGDFLAALSARAPLLLLLDDLHWADASSINLLFHLGRRLTHNRVLILGAYRPEEVRWDREGQEHPLRRVLNEFRRMFGDISLDLHQDTPQARRFVDDLLDTQPNLLGEDFRAQMTQGTRGHPLFATELLREMQKRGDVYLDEVGRWVASPTITWDAIPGRVEGVIANRIGHLEPPLRELLVTASVEGEEFTAEVLALLAGIDTEAVIKMLSVDLAKGHNLVRASGVEQLGDRRLSRYQFNHNLFQKYLYGTLDPVERVHQHRATGSAIEALYEGRTEAAVHLARHFREAGAIEQAVSYLRQAGEAAARVHANAEAINHYGEAVRLAQQIDTSDEDLCFLYSRLGRLLELDSSFDRALETYEELARLALQRGNRAVELASLIARVTILSVPTAVHDAARARELGERALNLAGALGDPAAEAKILWSLSLAHFFSNRLQDAIDCGERSLALARRHRLREQTAQSLNDLGGFIYLYSGRIGQARAALREAGDLWRELGNAPMLADSLGGSCIAEVYAGDFDRALANSEEAFRISGSIGNLWGQSYSRWTIGDVFAERGEFSRAIATMEECIRLGERAGFLASQTYTRFKLAQVCIELGALDSAGPLVRKGLEFARKHLSTAQQGMGVLARLQMRNGDLAGARASIREGRENPYRESWAVLHVPVLLAEAELALHERRSACALAVTGDLIARLRGYGMAALLPEALYLQGQAHLSMGQQGAAVGCFTEARAVAEGTGLRRISWRILLALSRLEPDPAQAAALRRRAREAVDFILAHFDAGHADLREAFLAQADVQAVLGDH